MSDKIESIPLTIHYYNIILNIVIHNHNRFGHIKMSVFYKQIF